MGLVAFGMFLTAGCRKTQSTEAVVPEPRVSAKVGQAGAMLPIIHQREMPDALAIEILRCEGPSAPCNGQLSRVLFTSRSGATSREVMKPHSLSEIKRNDETRLAVMTADDVRRAEASGPDVRFLHVEVTELESAGSYDIVTSALALDHTMMAVMLCSTERFVVSRHGEHWSCKRTAPVAP